MTFKTTVKEFGKALGSSFGLLIKAGPLRLAGATAFFTIFAIPPILLLLIQLLSLIFNKREISRQLLSHLGNIVGNKSVHKISEIVQAIKDLGTNWFMIIFGFIFLLFVSTTLFKVIQSSLNQLWQIKKIESKKIKSALLARLNATLIIVFTGFLFLASLTAESLKLVFGQYLNQLLPEVGFYLNNAIATLISIVMVMAWFTILFRYLADGKPTWRVAFSGGLLTSILFNIGKVVIKALLPHGNIGALYGTSASLVLLMLFVFYASLIFYYGAAFTKVWSEVLHKPIVTSKNAAHYTVEVEAD